MGQDAFSLAVYQEHLQDGQVRGPVQCTRVSFCSVRDTVQTKGPLFSMAGNMSNMAQSGIGHMTFISRPAGEEILEIMKSTLCQAERWLIIMQSLYALHCDLWLKQFVSHSDLNIGTTILRVLSFLFGDIQCQTNRWQFIYYEATCTLGSAWLARYPAFRFNNMQSAGSEHWTGTGN